MRYSLLFLQIPQSSAQNTFRAEDFCSIIIEPDT